LAGGFIAWADQSFFLKGQKIGVVGAATSATAPRELQEQYIDPLKAHAYDADLQVLPMHRRGVHQVGRQHRSEAEGRQGRPDHRQHLREPGDGGELFRELRSQGINAPVYSRFTDRLFNDPVLAAFVPALGADGTAALSQA
jgi:hypothetical protein